MDPASALREIILRFAENYEQNRSEFATFRVADEEGKAWLLRTFATLRSEGSTIEVQGGGGFK